MLIVTSSAGGELSGNINGHGGIVNTEPHPSILRQIRLQLLINDNVLVNHSCSVPVVVSDPMCSLSLIGGTTGCDTLQNHLTSGLCRNITVCRTTGSNSVEYSNFTSRIWVKSRCKVEVFDYREIQRYKFILPIDSRLTLYEKKTTSSIELPKITVHLSIKTILHIKLRLFVAISHTWTKLHYRRLGSRSVDRFLSFSDRRKLIMSKRDSFLETLEICDCVLLSVRTLAATASNGTLFL
jgi:hypothetical protein